MMSLSVGYPQKLVSGYAGSKFTIHFSPSYNKVTFYMKYHHINMYDQSSAIETNDFVMTIA